PPSADARGGLRRARPRGPGADAPRPRRAPGAYVARAWPLGGHRRAAPGARRQLRPRQRLLLGGGDRGARRVSAPPRDPLLPACDVVPGTERRTAGGGARVARELVTAA